MSTSTTSSGGTGTGRAVTAADRAAVAQVPQRITEAWANNDGDAFAAAFADDASLVLPGDVYLANRSAIASYMKAAFVGPYRGTRVFGQPMDVRFLSEDVAVLLTQGGVLTPGETEVSPERAIRALWVVVRQDDQWLLAAYQNTPVKA